MKQFRNNRGRFVSITDLHGKKFTAIAEPNLFLPYITDLFAQHGIDKAIRHLLTIFDLYNLQKLLSIHPYFKDRL
jgi:hypothetical protein